MNVFDNLPGIDINSEKISVITEETAMNVNAHFHTPYSFSSFNDIEEVFTRAEQDDIQVLGINDFITTAGYDEFAEQAVKHHRFPMFNIEFMGLIQSAQQDGIRINDPNNPGRIYMCGKGLMTPEKLTPENKSRLQKVYDESNRQVKEMVKNLNKTLQWANAPFLLDWDTIRNTYTKGFVRERHIVKALRIELLKHFSEEQDQYRFLTKIYKGKEQNAPLSDPVALDNELRSRLLKKGGPAFVPENPDAFLDVESINDIIRNAGGIPCYPVLLDDEKGNFTEFRIFAVELIPARNNIWFLKEFVEFFAQRQFIITFGTEHNTPEMIPLSITCRGNTRLTDEMRVTNYESACIIAAHQYLLVKTGEGYLKKSGYPHIDQRDRFITLGDAVIRSFIKN